MTDTARDVFRFEFVAVAPLGATVTIDASIRSTEQLLATLAAALDFAEDTGPTWAALVDRLSDASHQAGTEVFIDHVSLPDIPDTELHRYLGYLSDAFARRPIECAGLRVSFRANETLRVSGLLIVDAAIAPTSSEFTIAPPASEEAIVVVEQHLGRALPLPYREFLLRSNGGVGFAGDRHLILWRIEELIQLNADYEVQDAAPGFFMFGSNGGGEAFVFDLTKADFRVYMLPFIGMEPDMAKPILFPFAELAA